MKINFSFKSTAINVSGYALSDGIESAASACARSVGRRTGLIAINGPNSSGHNPGSGTRCYAMTLGKPASGGGFNVRAEGTLYIYAKETR